MEFAVETDLAGVDAPFAADQEDSMKRTAVAIQFLMVSIRLFV
jgi:hypothetical protein